MEIDARAGSDDFVLAHLSMKFVLLLICKGRKEPKKDCSRSRDQKRYQIQIHSPVFASFFPERSFANCALLSVPKRAFSFSAKLNLIGACSSSNL